MSYLDTRKLENACRLVDDGVEAGVYTGAVLLVTHLGNTVCRHAAGLVKPGGGSVTPDTRVDLASLTKPVVAAALLVLVETGGLTLTNVVSDFIEEARGSLWERTTLHELATHTSGLPPWIPLFNVGKTKSEMLRALLAAPRYRPPHARYAYSDLGYILLGEIIERVAGSPLKSAIPNLLLEPLGMSDTGYLPAATIRQKIVATANCPLRQGKVLQGEVHDANAHALGGTAGHAGLFGTAADVATFANFLLGCGGSEKPLGIASRRLASTNQLDAAVGGHSIGWFTRPNPMLPSGDLLGSAAFGHTGFTGTMVTCDPDLQMVIVLLTNRVFFPGDSPGTSIVRRKVMNAAASSLR